MSEEDEFGESLGGLIAALRAVGDQHWAEYFQRAADHLPGDLGGAARHALGAFGGMGSFADRGSYGHESADRLVGDAAEAAWERARQIVGRADRV